jgi:hypothetical protein
VSSALLDELSNSQQLVAAVLRMSDGEQPARVGAWSVRDIAGHLAATERDCFAPRIRAMAAGEKPAFDWFTNDETDFSGLQLSTALDDWAAERSRLLDFVRGLTDEERRRTGTHERYGEISVDRYLEIALEHDQEHLAAVEKKAGERGR